MSSCWPRIKSEFERVGHRYPKRKLAAFNHRRLLNSTPIQLAALFKHQNMSQTVQVGSCHGYHVVLRPYTQYNLPPTTTLLKNRKTMCVSKKHFPDLWHPSKVSEAIVCTHCATGSSTEWWNCSCKCPIQSTKASGGCNFEILNVPSFNDPIQPCALEIAVWKLKVESNYT